MNMFRNGRASLSRRIEEQAASDSPANIDLERGQPAAPAEPVSPPQTEMQDRGSLQSSFLSRLSIPRPRFAGGRSPANRTSTTPMPPYATSSHYSDEEELESPKSPNFSLRTPNLPSTQLHLPHLTREWTLGSIDPDPRPNTSRDNAAFQAASSRATEGHAVSIDSRIAEPSAAVVAEARSHMRLVGADPAEAELAEMAEDGRRRRRGGRHRNRHGRGHRHRHRGDRDRQRRERERALGSSGLLGTATARPEPKHFLFCFPWIRSRRIRTHILRCFVSGLILTAMLAVYLALSITKKINNSEFTVLLILVILIATVVFCHGMIRLCVLIMRGPENAVAEEQRQRQLSNMLGPGGYAVPREPIRIVLARDEEAAGIESEITKLNPPAYGVWRESVRVDPNRIYWARNDASDNTASSSASSSDSSSASSASSMSAVSRPRTAGPRPPSYASDDGVSYVVEARPRSMVPSTDVPVPPEPSEAGRFEWPAAH